MKAKNALGWAALAAALSAPAFGQPSAEAMKAQSGMRFSEISGGPSAAATPVYAGGERAPSALNALTNQQPPAAARALDADSVPPPASAPARKASDDDLRNRYGAIGRAAGSVALGTGLAAAGAVLGAPSVVGSVAAAILLGYAGSKAGAVAGQAIGRGVADAQIAVGRAVAAVKSTVANMRQFFGNVRQWWGIRPQYGKPWP